MELLLLTRFGMITIYRMRYMNSRSSIKLKNTNEANKRSELVFFFFDRFKWICSEKNVELHSNFISNTFHSDCFHQFNIQFGEKLQLNEWWKKQLLLWSFVWKQLFVEVLFLWQILFNIGLRLPNISLWTMFFDATNTT